MKNKLKRIIIIDPSSEHYHQGRLFDPDTPLNRDDCLLPVIKIRDAFKKQGVSVYTVDFLLSGKIDISLTDQVDYYSFGYLRDFEEFRKKHPVHLKAFIVIEPPTVHPRLYSELPILTRQFDQVYIYNTEGDAYSLKNVDLSKLSKFYCSQPYHDVLENYWSKSDRLNKIVMIVGNHRPSFRYKGNREQYSKRIRAAVGLSKFGAIDLYGMGWKCWWSSRSQWLVYWLHLKTILKIYKGPCLSKYKVLSHYNFSLCFENTQMKGYVTEKLIDCLYVGTIPLYLGAPDIADYIPSETFIDCRQFDSWKDLWHFVNQMSASQILEMKEAGRSFIQSKAFDKFYASLDEILRLKKE